MTEEQVAVEAALAAGAILRAHEHAERRVRHKGEVDLVTQVDLACEEAVREVLARHTPEIPVLGEEGGGAASAPTRWVVDPLDGTTNFVHGFPWYGVSVALEVDELPVVGVVHDPVRDLTWRATRGRGAFCGERRMRVSGCRELGEALVATGFPYDRRQRADFYAAHVAAVLSAAQGLRRAGAAALDLAHLADGHVDAYFEYRLGRWDLAAGRLLVEEAGGRVTPVPGEALGDRPCPLATNGYLHDAVHDLLVRVRGELPHGTTA